MKAFVEFLQDFKDALFLTLLVTGALVLLASLSAYLLVSLFDSLDAVS